MENQDQEDNQQERDKGAIPKIPLPTNNLEREAINSTIKEENDSTKTLQVEELPAATTSNICKKTIKNVQKLNDKSKYLCNKLTIKRHNLQQQEKQIQNNKDAIKENDLKAFKALQTMGRKSFVLNKYANNTVDASHVANGSGLTNGMVANVSLPMADPKPLHLHSKRQLESLVEGLQELVCKLTLNDQSLKTKIEHLAVNINGLKNFPLFGNNLDAASGISKGRQRYDSERNVVSSSQGRLKNDLDLNNVSSTQERPRHDSEGYNKGTTSAVRQRHDSDYYALPTTSGGRQRHDSDYYALPTTSGGKQRHDSDYQAKRRNSRRESEKSVEGNNPTDKPKLETKKKHEKVPEKKITPAEIFAKYINAMISDYLGEQQQELIGKLKCLPANIDNLELYALTLVQAGLGRIVEEEIRINRKNNRQAFIVMSNERDSLEKDGIVLLPVARRYAFEGDVVKAFVLNPGGANFNSEEESANKKPRKISTHITGGKKDNSISLADDDEVFNDTESSPESDNDEITDLLDTSATVVPDNCPKAFVISIVKQTELREIVGSISFMKTTTLNSKSYYKLKPHDMKVPMVYIPKELCKDHIEAANKEDIVGMLYLARVLETDNHGHCIGELVQPVGKVGNLKAEIKAILLHNGLKDLKPYEQKFHDMYNGPAPEITEEELNRREDLRKKCVFTIDPLTARDLDDAVSVEKLNDEEYEIGVHISDVAYYLQENSDLDNLVKERATSIYLVNEVIHMLPPSLCFRCSLLPGEDKLAFSVFWRWNVETEIMSSPRFTRSIINSCSQFAYEHAQKVIDNPKETFDRDDFPEIFNMWSPGDIKWRILLLHQISQKLKAQRYVSGALSINNPKLRFQLDPITGEPLAYEVEGRQEANYLIEEFMLLANQSVAKFIHDHFPDTSILRNHSPPLQKSMKCLRERLANMGLDFDVSSSKTIYESMQRLSREAADPKAMDACLSTLLTKPMARARYYCSEGKTDDADFWHYALSIPIYTHFTSPIRRYPDILVHRLLAASLNYCPPPQRTTDELHQLAKVCNDQKFNAKNAGDESIELFFTRYVKAKQSITLKAVVTDIFKHMLNVVTIETGHSLTITYKLQKVLVNTANVPSFVLITEKNSQLPPVKLQLFSTVDINVTLRNDKICGFFVSPDIKQRRINSKESSKRDKLVNNISTANSFKYNHHYQQQHNNSISEQDDDNTPTTSSKSKKKSRHAKRNKNNNERIYAIANDK